VYTKCCADGALKNQLLIDETIPKELLDLYIPAKGCSSQKKKKTNIFLNNILALNNLFAMTSFAAKATSEWQYYRVDGNINHRLDHIMPENKDNANFAQVFFFFNLFISNIILKKNLEPYLTDN